MVDTDGFHFLLCSFLDFFQFCHKEYTFLLQNNGNIIYLKQYIKYFIALPTPVPRLLKGSWGIWAGGSAGFGCHILGSLGIVGSQAIEGTIQQFIWQEHSQLRMLSPEGEDTAPAQNVPTCNNMDGLRGYCAKWNKSDKDNYCITSLICGI